MKGIILTIQEYMYSKLSKGDLIVHYSSKMPTPPRDAITWIPHIT